MKSIYFSGQKPSVLNFLLANSAKTLKPVFCSKASPADRLVAISWPGFRRPRCACRQLDSGKILLGLARRSTKNIRFSGREKLFCLTAPTAAPCWSGDCSIIFLRIRPIFITEAVVGPGNRAVLQLGQVYRPFTVIQPTRSDTTQPVRLRGSTWFPASKTFQVSRFSLIACAVQTTP